MEQEAEADTPDTGEIASFNKTKLKKMATGEHPADQRPLSRRS